MKKLMIVAVLLFAFALTVAPALAYDGCGQCGSSMFRNRCACPDQSNTATGVTNNISSKASVGDNTVMGGFFGGGAIFTDSAISQTEGVNAINSNLKTGFSMGSQSQTNTAKFVTNNISSEASVGGNTVIGSGMVMTGGASSATRGINLVNTNLKIGGSW